MEQLPTVYSKLAGIKVAEYDALPDGMKVAIRDEQNNIIYGHYRRK